MQAAVQAAVQTAAQATIVSTAQDDLRADQTIDCGWSCITDSRVSAHVIFLMFLSTPAISLLLRPFSFQVLHVSISISVVAFADAKQDDKDLRQRVSRKMSLPASTRPDKSANVWNVASLPTQASTLDIKACLTSKASFICYPPWTKRTRQTDRHKQTNKTASVFIRQTLPLWQSSRSDFSES